MSVKSVCTVWAVDAVPPFERDLANRNQAIPGRAAGRAVDPPQHRRPHEGGLLVNATIAQDNGTRNDIIGSRGRHRLNRHLLPPTRRRRRYCSNGLQND